jgi:pantoate--beta-alanine ligase
MGALHAGHGSLIRHARVECDRVVVTIFVNPTQFGPSEDLDAYPRPEEDDLAACRSAGVDVVLLGVANDLYPPGFQTWVTVERLSQPLCGPRRPGHFRGVATVVAQLLHIVRPHRAYFGMKDYQQSRVIGRMIADLHIDTELRCCDTVREPDGLAMSSRNAYLDPESRALAPRLYQALQNARELVAAGERRVDAMRASLVKDLSGHDGIELDYAEVLDAETLQELADGHVATARSGVLLAVAARIGPTRLIDNTVVPPEDLRGPPDRHNHGTE